MPGIPIHLHDFRVLDDNLSGYRQRKMNLPGIA